MGDVTYLLFASNLLKGQTVVVIGAETPASKTNENRWIRMKCSQKVLHNAPKIMATSKEQLSIIVLLTRTPEVHLISQENIMDSIAPDKNRD
ncbi:uncharacterized protein LOC131223499 isoform X2 [Magnolia sinica]|uniref:uncharacterized protein LOC131223499 isoform X2 n=1 Tax=Magnolia sinica TaxID=86752 RepID=UPI00265ABA15|nr:uncharacterized protein LOC131223499 isoform X2 [Magnolia sinica]